MHPDCPELERFVRGEIDTSAFPHREHVRMAFEMLRRHDFAETVWHFSRTLRAMAAKAGFLSGSCTLLLSRLYRWSAEPCQSGSN